MNISESILIILAVVSIISLFLNFIMFSHLSRMNIYTTQLHTGISNLLNRSLVTEQVLGKVAITLEEFVDALDQVLEQIGATGPVGKQGQLYRTMDGKYSAPSLEELVEKIKNNDEEDKYFQEEDMDKLRQLFEEDSDDDEEEDKLF